MYNLLLATKSMNRSDNGVAEQSIAGLQWV